MDAVLALAQWWWAAPVVAGGAAAWAGLRMTRRVRVPRAMSRGAARRLELDAALHDLREAEDAGVRNHAEVQAARADLARLQAVQSGSGAVSAAAVAGARRRMQIAQQEVKAVAADIRARRAAVRAARITLPPLSAGPEAQPLARLMRQHDAVLVRWMAYETDPALAIAYPSMIDVRSPMLAEFLREQSLARDLRPSSPTARTPPASFAAYRDSVRRLQQAFDAAEFDARRRAGEVPTVMPDVVADAWNGIAQGLADGVQQAFTRSVEALRDRAAARTERPPTWGVPPRGDHRRPHP